MNFAAGISKIPVSRVGSALIGLMKLRFMTDFRCQLLCPPFSPVLQSHVNTFSPSFSSPSSSLRLFSLCTFPFCFSLFSTGITRRLLLDDQVVRFNYISRYSAKIIQYIYFRDFHSVHSKSKIFFWETHPGEKITYLDRLIGGRLILSDLFYLSLPRSVFIAE